MCERGITSAWFSPQDSSPSRQKLYVHLCLDSPSIPVNTGFQWVCVYLCTPPHLPGVACVCVYQSSSTDTCSLALKYQLICFCCVYFCVGLVNSLVHKPHAALPVSVQYLHHSLHPASSPDCLCVCVCEHVSLTAGAWINPEGPAASPPPARFKH